MNDWELPGQGRAWRSGETGISPVRVALLFGSAAIALALIATPMLDGNTRGRGDAAIYAGDLDFMSTGSTVRPASARPGTSYVLRRSVLQPTPSSVCVLHASGARTGDC